MADENDSKKPTSKDYTSQFKPYSIGVVTANKGEGTGLLDVQPIEIQWASNGEIVNNYAEETVEGKDREGQDVKYGVVTSNNITAAWMPMGNSNRISPPELRRGMLVMIYKDSDNNYYWVDTGLNREYMRAESVTYGFCANPSVTDNAKVSQDDWYIAEIAPRNHQMMITTSQKNGEYTTYTIVLNTEEGFFKIADGLGNFVILDSKNVQIRMENQKGTFLEMLGEDITINAPKNITINAGDNITVTGGKDITTNAGSNYSNTSGSNYTVNSGSQYTMTSATYTFNATSGRGTATGSGMRIDGEIDAGTIKTEGNIHAGGDITAGGNIDCKH